jgi:trehalose/maltose transport system substrate-binding protein
MEADSLNAFRAGNAAFLRHWSAGFASNNDTDSPIRERFRATLLPAGPHGRAQSMGGFHLAVSQYSKYPREAAKLVRYLTSAPVESRRALARGYLPTIPRLYQDPAVAHALPYVETLRNVGAAAWIARPSTVSGTKYGEVSRAYYESVHEILRHPNDAESGLNALEQQLMAITGLHSGAPRE